jgi:hypothetical protein
MGPQGQPPAPHAYDALPLQGQKNKKLRVYPIHTSEIPQYNPPKGVTMEDEITAEAMALKMRDMLNEHIREVIDEYMDSDYALMTKIRNMVDTQINVALQDLRIGRRGTTLPY